MANTTISDFFGSYPDISDPNFNSLLSRKEEFSELTLDVSEPPPKRGGKFKHQEFAMRYGTWYDHCLFLHDPGTGKSCIIAGLAELFKTEYRKDEGDPTKIKRAVILVRGPTLEANIRNEIVCKCTDRIYETDAVMRAKDETIMKRAITNELKKWYDIMTYKSFASTLDKMTREEDKDAFMSNKAFFVDEAHNIATLEDIRQTEELRQDPVVQQIERSDLGEPIETGTIDETTYQIIKRAFHMGKRNKFFMFTATPMINTPHEFPFLMNLILPMNFQMPLWSKEQFAMIQLANIEPYLRGRVSYVRASDTGVVRVNPPGSVKIPDRHIYVYPCDMSPFQYAGYLEADYKDRVSASGLRRSGFNSNARQAANFVFPDRTWGSKGFERYMEKIGNRYTYKSNNDGLQLKQLLGREDGLKWLSRKFYNVIKICKAAIPPTRESGIKIKESQGIVFVYFPEYVNGSGAIICGKAFEENGYEEYTESTSIFGGQSIAVTPCGAQSLQGETERPARIARRPRYALLTSLTTPAQMFSLFNTLKSYENRYGEYIQTIIVSSIGQEGISIDNAVASIMTSSDWNFTRQFQAENRVFRSTSHVIRLNEKKRDLLAAGEPPEVINQATLEVRVYNMASIYQGDPNASDERLRTSNLKTIDIDMFSISEEKNKAIRKVIRFCKESAIDCYTNRKRNIRPGDENGSAACDYMECDYTCAGIKADLMSKIDRTTKILFYSEPEILSATAAIKQLFTIKSSLQLSDIYKAINTDEIFIDMALEEMIRTNTYVVDHFGQFGYLRESSSGLIYIEKDQFSIQVSPEDTIYTSALIGVQDSKTNVFADYVANIDAENQAPLMQELTTVSPDSPRFQEILDVLTLSNKAVLLEYFLLQREAQHVSSLFGEALISAFSQSIYRMKEPLARLREAQYALTNQGKGRGRKPAPGTKPKIKKAAPIPTFEVGAESEEIIIHTLHSQAYSNVTYNVATGQVKAEDKFRILKPSDPQGWRDVNQYEQIVYKEAIERQMESIRAYYSRFPIYGILTPPSNVFKIVDREKENVAQSQTDNRFTKSGRNCSTWNKADLVDVIARLRLPISIVQPMPDRNTIIMYLRSLREAIPGLDTADDTKLMYLYILYQGNITKEQLCSFIRSHLEASGRLFTGKIPSELLNRQLIPVGPDSGSVQTPPNPTPQQVGYDTEVILADISGTYDLGDFEQDVDYDYE